MKTFAGFPAYSRVTPVPNLFITEVMPRIEDVAELKATLRFLHLLAGKRGYPRFVSGRELVAGEADPEGLLEGLKAAVKRGVVLALHADSKDAENGIYFLNSEADKRAIARIRSGELVIGAVAVEAAAPLAVDKPSIYELYERNVGLVTPIIADELREAEGLYPTYWIEDAFREAVELNKRSWRYIVRILERWAREGRGGEPGRDPKPRQSAQDYLKGKYGHVIKH